MKVKCFECDKSSVLELEIYYFFRDNKNIKIISTNQSLNQWTIVFTIIYEEIQ
jgi:hypothetical protein